MAGQKLKIIQKTELSPKTYLIKLEMEESLDYKPGQFFVLQLGPKIFRSYSIVDLEDKLLTLLIDAKVGGPGSQFFEQAQPGHELRQLGNASGVFRIQPTNKQKIFIATGTGLAPFVPMIKAAVQLAPSRLYFGCRTKDANFAPQFLSNHPNLTIFPCISREKELPPQFFQGYVTDAVLELEKDFTNSEFYICGNPKMINDMQKILEEKGAEHIYIEKYGA